MKVRSLGLAILGAGLLASAAILGAVLVHDGETDPVPLEDVHEGDTIEVKGRPEPFFPDSLALWAPVRPLLGNHSYLLQPEAGFVLLLTSDAPVPDDVVLAHGRVAHVGPHPSEPGLALLVVQVEDWRQPLLFQ